MDASLFTAARRLRHLRRYPRHFYGPATQEQATSMAMAFEYALQVLLDEYGITPGSAEYAGLFYGPQGEDPDIQPHLDH